jgi:hypothetical protein
MVGGSLTAISLVLLSVFVFARSMRPGTLSGFGVLVADPSAVKVQLALKPDFRTLDIEVSVLVSSPDTLATTAPQAVIVFPGFTIGHRYALSAEGDSPIGRRVEAPEGVVTHDPRFGEDRISVRPLRKGDSTVMMEFIWVHGLSRTGFAEYQLLLPIGPLGREDDSTLTVLPTFGASMSVSPGIRPQPVSPAPAGMRVLGDLSIIYYHDCATNLPLEVLFERPLLSQTKEFALVLVGVLLGTGATILVEFRKGRKS